MSRLIMSSHLSGEKINLPPFKFYSSLCIEIIHQAKKLGVEYKSILSDIRLQAQSDFRFSIKILQVFWEALAQFGVLFFVTWGFAGAIYYIFKEKLSWEFIILVLSLQVLGTVIFSLFYYVKVRRNNLIFTHYFSCLYIFKGLLKINLPVKILCEKSQILTLLESTKGFSDIRDSLKSLINQMINLGGEGVDERVELICSELLFKQEVSFDKIYKQTQTIKLVVILFFFVPAYLLNIWGILGKIGSL